MEMEGSTRRRKKNIPRWSGPDQVEMRYDREMGIKDLRDVCIEWLPLASSDMAVGQNRFGIPFWGRCTTHCRTYFSGDWDVRDFDPWPYASGIMARAQNSRAKQ